MTFSVRLAPQLDKGLRKNNVRKKPIKTFIVNGSSENKNDLQLNECTAITIKMDMIIPEILRKIGYF